MRWRGLLLSLGLVALVAAPLVAGFLGWLSWWSIVAILAALVAALLAVVPLSLSCRGAPTWYPQRASVRRSGDVGTPLSAGGWRGGIPFGTREGPLPHDGLFVRRNNAFGTRLTLGVGDLVEQGVLVDQEQIRFDDFVAGSTDDVPPPTDGSALAVRHGWAPAGDHNAHEETTHFLEIALRATPAPADGHRDSAPLPVNFVFVVDTSGSMAGEKIDSVKSAILGLYGQLRDSDVLGIVTFDTQVRTALRATPKAELTEDRLAGIVAGLRASGGTDINLGVLYGLDELSRHSAGGDFANYVYLFSDGDPTSGVTDWIRIRTNIAARVRGDVTLSCFGFGFDARMRELDALAGLTGGHSTFVTHPDLVRLNLTGDLTRREHLAAINIQLKIEIPADVTIWHLYGHDLITDRARRRAVEAEARDAGRRGREGYGVDALPDLITEETGIRIFAPDLAFGEVYWIVFEVQAPDGAQPPDFGTATVQYLDTALRQNRRQRLALSERGAIPDNAVLAHAVGLWTSEVTFYALDDLYANDRDSARRRLSNHARVLQSAYTMTTMRQFRDDRVTMIKLMSLAENLGQPRRWSDLGEGGWGHAIHAMSRFGQVRGGYLRAGG